MKPWFSDNKFRPFIVLLPKTIGELGVICTVGDGYGWLNKKLVLKQLDVIADAVGVEYLKTFVDFTTVVVDKRLPGRHYIQFGV